MDCCEHSGGTFVETVAPTCSIYGYDVYENCALCGSDYEDNWVESLGHTDGNLVSSSAPTCSNYGYELYDKCSHCGFPYFVELYKSEHTGTFVETVAPTCTNDGYDLYKCTVCGEEYYENFTDSTSHTGTYVETILPTCENGGAIICNCSLCGEDYEIDWASSLGHSAGNLVESVAPGCGYDGYDLYECSHCGTNFFKNWVSGPEHTGGTFITTVPPTCEEYGYDYYESCSRCGCDYADNWVENTYHDYKVLETVAPTCSTRGYDYCECTVCGELTYDFNVPASGHNFVDDKCTVCYKFAEDCIESDHNYSSDTDKTWTISKPGASFIAVTFSIDTVLEQGFDFIYIYDKNDNEIGCYTGTELAGTRVMVNSDVVKIRLVSDGSITDYGFVVEDIYVNSYFGLTVQEPSRTTIRCKDSIVLRYTYEGEPPCIGGVIWGWDNDNFDVEDNGNGTITITSKNKGYTTFTAYYIDATGEVVAYDTIEMYSKAGFFDKIGGFFRSLFGTTKTYDN